VSLQPLRGTPLSRSLVCLRNADRAAWLAWCCRKHSDWDVSKAAPGAAAQPGAPGAVQTDQVVVLCGKKTTMNAVVKLVLGGCVPSLVPHPLARGAF
jgi:hypothetical protein